METGGNQMFENIKNIFKRSKKRELLKSSSKDTAKERLHLVLMQDRANVSADFLDLMRQEIVEVIKKYIDIDEDAMDVRLGTETNEDGTQGAPALYANIPIINIKDETRQMSKTNQDKKITTNIVIEKIKTEDEKSEGKDEKVDKTKQKEQEKKIEEKKICEEQKKPETAKEIKKEETDEKVEEIKEDKTEAKPEPTPKDKKNKKTAKDTNLPKSKENKDMKKEKKNNEK